MKSKASEVFQEGRAMIEKKYFTEEDECAAETKIKELDSEIQGLGQSVNKELDRCDLEFTVFDISRNICSLQSFCDVRQCCFSGLSL